LKIIEIFTKFLKLNGLKSLTLISTRIGTNSGKEEKEESWKEVRKMLKTEHYFNYMTNPVIVNSFFVDYYFEINKILERRVRK